MIRTYIIICPSCNGRGHIPNPEIGITTVVTVVCPACKGSKTVIVTEQTNENTK